MARQKKPEGSILRDFAVDSRNQLIHLRLCGWNLNPLLQVLERPLGDSGPDIYR